MNVDLRELYQEVILDHNKRPRNRHALEDATNRSEGHNPLCGDQVTVFLKAEDGRVVDIAFEGQGCAISTASASLMTEAVKGKTLEEADSDEEHPNLGQLQVLAGVKDHPVRIKCATLPWHTLNAALSGEGKVSTE